MLSSVRSRAPSAVAAGMRRATACSRHRIGMAVFSPAGGLFAGPESTSGGSGARFHSTRNKNGGGGLLGRADGGDKPSLSALVASFRELAAAGAGSTQPSSSSAPAAAPRGARPHQERAVAFSGASAEAAHGRSSDTRTEATTRAGSNGASAGRQQRRSGTRRDPRFALRAVEAMPQHHDVLRGMTALSDEQLLREFCFHRRGTLEAVMAAYEVYRRVRDDRDRPLSDFAALAEQEQEQEQEQQQHHFLRAMGGHSAPRAFRAHTAGGGEDVRAETSTEEEEGGRGSDGVRDSRTPSMRFTTVSQIAAFFERAPVTGAELHLCCWDFERGCDWVAEVYQLMARRLFAVLHLLTARQAADALLGLSIAAVYHSSDLSESLLGIVLQDLDSVSPNTLGVVLEVLARECRETMFVPGAPTLAAHALAPLDAHLARRLRQNPKLFADSELQWAVGALSSLPHVSTDLAAALEPMLHRLAAHGTMRALQRTCSYFTKHEHIAPSAELADALLQAVYDCVSKTTTLPLRDCATLVVFLKHQRARKYPGAGSQLQEGFAARLTAMVLDLGAQRLTLTALAMEDVDKLRRSLETFARSYERPTALVALLACHCLPQSPPRYTKLLLPLLLQCGVLTSEAAGGGGDAHRPCRLSDEAAQHLLGMEGFDRVAFDAHLSRAEQSADGAATGSAVSGGGATTRDDTRQRVAAPRPQRRTLTLTVDLRQAPGTPVGLSVVAGAAPQTARAHTNSGRGDNAAGSPAPARTGLRVVGVAAGSPAVAPLLRLCGLRSVEQLAEHMRLDEWVLSRVNGANVASLADVKRLVAERAACVPLRLQLLVTRGEKSSSATVRWWRAQWGEGGRSQ